MIYNYRKKIAEFALETVGQEVETFCELNGVPSDKLFSIQLIIEEIVTNIIKYGKGESSNDFIEIELKVEADEINLTIYDSTAAFNPLEKETANTELSVEERNIGGLGLFLVRKRVKSIRYGNKNGLNILKAEI